MPNRQDTSSRPSHAMDIAAICVQLDTDRNAGLSAAQARRRLEADGPNSLESRERWARTKRLGRQFNDVLIWVLIVAALLSGVLLGEWIDAAAIGAIIVLNAVLGYTQESRAERALANLESLGAPTAKVIRDSTLATVPSSSIVVGDLITLEAGDRIPADARVVEEAHLEAMESSLTGESLPVSKQIDPAETEAGVGDRKSMVFSGTTVAAGRGRAVVTATGARTELGAIASALSQKSPPTPLQVEMGRIGRRLGIVALASGVLIFGAGLLQSYPIETMLLTAVALAVAAIPEGLPAVITVTLAGGTSRMARRNAIVRRLPAVEALGAVDVICTDKTGTLTKADLAVAVALLGDDELAAQKFAESAARMRRLGTNAALCNDAQISGDAGIGDPTEIALLMAAPAMGVDLSTLRETAPRLDEAAFDSSRKRMSTLNSIDGQLLVSTKGAPEVVIARCSFRRDETGVRELDQADREALHQRASNLAARGYRTLALASKELTSPPDDLSEEENGMTLEGIVGLQDEVRPEVPDAIEKAASAGVRTVMVTGDHRVTAASVADETGLVGGEILNGDDLREISTHDLAASIGEFRGFSRVDPGDKVKIVDAWRSRDAVVAMTGDGVNDAPALKVADVGVAMGSGTDVSRESADLILTDDNYATIVAAIEEGRRIFRNLRNVVHYLLSANASEVLYMLVGFLAFGFLGEPLLAVQLLWINLLSDALPALALGVDVPTQDLMSEKPGAGRDVLGRRNLMILITQGAALAAASLLVLVIGAFWLDAGFEETRTMVFSTLVFSQLLHAINVRSDSDKRLSPPHRPLVGAIAISAILQFVVIYTAFGHTFLHTAPLSLLAMTIVFFGSVLSMVVVRAINRRVWR